MWIASPMPDRFAYGLLFAALAFPWVWPLGLPLFPAFPNEVLAVAGWGLVWLIAKPAARTPRFHGALGLACAVAFLALGAIGPIVQVHRDPGYALLTLGLLVAATATARGIGLSALNTTPALLWSVAAAALTSAGWLNALTAMVQAWAPGWLEGTWVLPSTLPHRSTGLIRQPNHLGMLVVWAVLALGAVVHFGRLRPRTALALCAPMLLGLALSGSRVAAVLAVALPLLGAWRLGPGHSRRFLLTVPGLLLGAVLLAYFLGAETDSREGLIQHMQSGSPSRWPMLVHTLDLVRQHAVWGTGWGNFNLVWSLTPRDWSTSHLVQHCHNLPLQLVAELGAPLGLAVLGLASWGLAAGVRSAWRDGRSDGRWFAALMVVGVAAHSMVELPLWYAHWLLPTAFFLGVMATPSLETDAPRSTPGRYPGRMAVAGALMIGMAFVASQQYLRVLPIYVPGPNPAPLLDRLQAGSSAWLFRPVVSFAAATSLRVDLPVMAHAAQSLIDAKLLHRWALQLHAQGRVDEGLFLLERLRAIHSPEASTLSTRCAATSDPSGFPCGAPQRHYTPWDLISTTR